MALREQPHPSAAAATFPWAARHAAAFATFAPGAAAYGSMHLYAGLLANGCGRTDQAIEHLRAAVEANARIGAAPFLALSLHELANLTDNRTDARLLRRQCHDLARRIGVPWLCDPKRPR